MKYLSILHWVEENPAAVDLFSDVTPRLHVASIPRKLVFLSEGLELFLRIPREPTFLRMQSSEGQKSEQDSRTKHSLIALEGC